MCVSFINMTADIRELTRIFRQKLENFPTIGLIQSPTPLNKLNRLTTHLDGPDIWIKRDDATHISSGGNKLRKLDRVLRAAIDSGCDAIVSGGVPQSNSQRQVATAAAVLGLECHLVVYHGRVKPSSQAYNVSGNVVLNKIFGAHMYPVNWEGDRNIEIDSLSKSLKSKGKTPFIVPYGVSNALGALSYSSVVSEIAEQSSNEGFLPSAIVAASGSGGTQAGLVIGANACLPDTNVIGIDVDAEPERVKADVSRFVKDGSSLISAKSDNNKIEVISGYAGPAYGIPHKATLEAIRLAATLEGIILDPVYSGKALAGLIGLIKAGRFSNTQSVVLIHTGGMPAVFAYPEIF